MSDANPSAPHFLRVVRTIARVRDAAIPVVAVTTVIAGVACGAKNGAEVIGVEAMDGGNGGATTTSHTGGGATTSSSTSTSLGSGGFMTMSDAGDTDGGDGGH